ncbi:hypothetical protein [Streptomyces radiopugnans]|uniref:Integral membrane protein n=1 Tax=Streptomyces radiopugnans TaxID=403935 RepID=A0A1H9H4D6_9ACTN|nr:hypothetical protein [Streptomyces radiopugnans]SEQ57186.1 hypothetical protein SAMN05216481_110101 [Streptomyces radiopugnans]
MYGPAATPPPAPSRRGPGFGGIALRLFFASFPVWSVGLLAWVPSLRFAVIRRRPLDWAVFAVSVVLTVVYVVLLVNVPASEPGEEGMAQFWAGLYIVLLIGGSVAHAVLGDRFLRDPAPYPAAAPLPGGPHTPHHPAPPAPGFPGLADAPTAYGHPRPGPAVPPPVPPPAPSARPPAYGHPQPRQSPPVQPPQSPRMRQVASELDELGELLRKRDGHHGHGGGQDGGDGWHGR